MLKDLTRNGITYKLDDGAAETLDVHTLNSFFHMNGCFDAGLRYKYPSVTKVVINVPATVVFWSDGTKTVVKCAKNEKFDAEKGVAMAIAKKFLPKQYGRKLTAMTDEALSKYEDSLRKSNDKLKKDTEKKACWNCKYKDVALYDYPCRNCRSRRDRSEWVPAKKKER